MGLFNTTKLFGMTIRESANDGSDFTNPDADYRRLFLGEDGWLHVKDSAGAVTDPYDATGGGGGLVAYDINTYTGGDITFSSTTPAAVTGPTNLVVAATAGDLINVGLSLLINNTTANSIGFDYATIVSAAPVNYLSSATGTPITIGVMGWYKPSAILGVSNGAYPYVVQGGDISGGNVTLSLYARVSAGSRVIAAAATTPLVTWAQNLGQP